MYRIAAACLSIFLVILIGGSSIAADPWSAPMLEDFQQALVDLEFDDFIEDSYHLYQLCFPQGVTSAGTADEYGILNNALNDYSQEYALETFAIERFILQQLLTFDPDMLTAKQLTTFEIAVWYWDDLVRGQEFYDHWLPVHFMGTRSLHGYTEFSLTESHPFANEQDVLDYIARLNAIGHQFDQIIDQLERRQEAGIVAPGKTLEWAIPAIQNNMNARYSQHPLYVAAEEKAAGIPELTEERLTQLLSSVADAIDDVVKPAYLRLYVSLSALLRRAPSAISLSQYEGGQAAYAYDLRHYTQTERTAAEIHDLGLREVARVQEELRQAAQELGLDATASISEIIAFAVTEGGTAGGNMAITVTEDLIAQAEQLVVTTGALTELPEAKVAVLADPAGGGYYSPGSMDGSRLGAYYVSGGTPMERYRMASVAFHETIPGHHVQISIAQALDLPLLRRDVIFSGFSEGWALYSERLMYELGIYEGDPLGNIGRLKYELLRAARLVVDTGMHALGWSFEETVVYLMENLGDTRGTAEYRTLRYTVIPGQATAYMVGMLELLELREMAHAALGEVFDLAEFHDIVLGNGNVPLTFVRQLVDAWIKAGTATPSGS